MPTTFTGNMFAPPPSLELPQPCEPTLNLLEDAPAVPTLPWWLLVLAVPFGSAAGAVAALVLR